MGEIRKCPNCGNLQTHGGFCSKCGTDISNAKPFIEDYAPVVQSDASREYRVLHFVADFFVFLGWLIVIVTIVSVCLILSSAVGFNAIANMASGTPLGNVISASGVIGGVLLLFGGISIGLGEIAVGQLIMVFLDIRNDVRKLTNE